MENSQVYRIVYHRVVAVCKWKCLTIMKNIRLRAENNELQSDRT